MESSKRERQSPKTQVRKIKETKKRFHAATCTRSETASGKKNGQSAVVVVGKEPRADIFREQKSERGDKKSVGRSAIVRGRWVGDCLQMST